MASAGHAMCASRVLGRPNAQVQRAAAAPARTTQQWLKQSAAQARLPSKRCVRSRAHDKTSLHLLSSEESDDGTILFRFGDEELKKQDPVSGSVSDTQQSEAGTQRHASKSKTPKAVAEAAQSIASTESHSSPSNTGSAPAELPTQQTALTDSEVELNGHNSSVDTSDAEDSDTISKRLADMTPEQLENLKVADLKSLCKQEQVKGYSKLKKDELVSLLKEEIQLKQ